MVFPKKSLTAVLYPQDDRVQPGDEVHPRQNRERRKAGSQEEEEGGGSGAETLQTECHQADCTAVQTQRTAKGRNFEEESTAGQGAAAASTG